MAIMLIMSLSRPRALVTRMVTRARLGYSTTSEVSVCEVRKRPLRDLATVSLSSSANQGSSDSLSSLS